MAILPTCAPGIAIMFASELTTDTLWKEIAGICMDGILPFTPKVATPLFAPFSVAATKSVAALFAAVPKVLWANTSVPITKPKLLRASDAVVAPVPPLATATVPDKVAALASIVISADPSKGTPLIFLGAANLVAVAAFPVVLWFKVGKLVRFAALPFGRR